MTKLETIEHLIEELPPRQKISLVRKLEEQTAQNRMEEILKRIWRRTKQHPISQKQITNEVKTVRKKLYAKYYN